ncbi:MAG: PilZ domain-containing protein [Proteobacteria bacterium]|nr:PilZ domain-containing protein [Pseudomonadota bacterium]MBU1688779.1 PilZ domain-containing protein [Pseudomonadota bacterium]
MMNRPDERRQDVRVTFRASAKLEFSGSRRFEECETKNVSVSGVFVEGVTGVALGEKCDVEFHLVGRTSTLVLEMAAEVVRIEDTGVALQFYDVDQDSFCHMQNIVYFNYKHSGELSEITDEYAVEVEDESLYFGIVGDYVPLPDDYLDEDEDLDDEFSSDLDQDIIDQVRYQKDNDDY